MMIRGKEETQVSKGVSPDWKKVVSECEKLLTKSKSINVIGYLVIDLFQIEGFAGIRMGIELLPVRLVNYRAGIYPLSEDDEDEPFAYTKNKLDLLFSGKENLFLTLNEAVITNSNKLKNFTIKGIVKLLCEYDKIKIRYAYNLVKDSTKENIIFNLKSLEALLGNIKKINSIFQYKPNEGIELNVEEFSKILESVTDHLEVGLSKHRNDDSGTQEENLSSNNCFEKHKVPIRMCKNIILYLQAMYQWTETNLPSSPVLLVIKRALSTFDMNFADLVLDLANNGYFQRQNLFADALKQVNYLHNKKIINQDHNEAEYIQRRHGRNESVDKRRGQDLYIYVMMIYRMLYGF